MNETHENASLANGATISFDILSTENYAFLLQTFRHIFRAWSLTPTRANLLPSPERIYFSNIRRMLFEIRLFSVNVFAEI